MSVSDLSLYGVEPIQAALTASNELICALCAPATSRGLNATGCRILLQLWKEDGLTLPQVATRTGLGRPNTVAWVGTLERIGYLRRSHRGRRANVWLTPQGREAAAALVASACPERFDALRPEIASLRDLLSSTLRAAERAVSRAA